MLPLAQTKQTIWSKDSAINVITLEADNNSRKLNWSEIILISNEESELIIKAYHWQYESENNCRSIDLELWSTCQLFLLPRFV